MAKRTTKNKTTAKKKPASKSKAAAKRTGISKARKGARTAARVTKAKAGTKPKAAKALVAAEAIGGVAVAQRFSGTLHLDQVQRIASLDQFPMTDTADCDDADGFHSAFSRFSRLREGDPIAVDATPMPCSGRTVLVLD